jgi:hypothetical protein
MAANALKKITAKAKQIRKAHGGSWKSAVKQAGKLYREGRISGSRPKKVSGHKSRSHSTPRKRHKIRGGGVVTIGGLRNSGFNQSLEKTRDQVHEELGWLLAAQRTARTKGEKKKLQPKINELTRLLKAFQGK